MKIYLSDKLPASFNESIRALGAQYHVDVVRFLGHVVTQPDDVVIADVQDAWGDCKHVAVMLVCVDELSDTVMRGRSKVSPFFIPKSFIQDSAKQTSVVHQIEQVIAAQWVVKSNLQEVHARIRELIDDLQEQVRAVRILFRNALRKSFPKHEHVEASFQYMDQGAGSPIHYLDYFGAPKSQKLWVLGATTQSYGQSADMIDLLQQHTPRPDQEDEQAFLDQWSKRLTQLPSYAQGQLQWTWICFNFQEATAVIGCQSPHQGVIWTYSSHGLRPVAYDRAAQSWTRHDLGPKEVLFFIQGFSEKETKHLQEIDRMYASLKLPADTALSHLHDQLLQYCHDHQAMPTGGPSMLFRLRPSVFRVIESQE